MSSVYYEWYGETEEETSESVARLVIVPQTEERRYYIKTNRGQLLNPNAADFFRLKGNGAVWKKVTQESFMQYIRYLNSGVERYLNYARRGIQS